MTFYINYPIVSAVIIPILLLFSYKIPPKVTHHTFSVYIIILYIGCDFNYFLLVRSSDWLDV